MAAGEAAARKLAASTKLFAQTTSLGSVESLIEHRASVAGEGRRRHGICCGYLWGLRRRRI